MATNQTNTNTLYTVSAIFSGIAALLLLVTDFGGLYYYYYYGVGSYLEVWVYVHLFTNFLSFILIAGLIGGFLYTVYLVQGAIRKNIALDQEKIELLWMISLASLIVVIFGLLIFIVESFEATEMWLDAAFFASIIGAGVNVYIFNMIKKTPSTYVPEIDTISN
jgi:hypothetical protein